MRDSKTEFPPLWVWIVFSLVAAGLVLSLIIVQGKKEQKDFTLRSDYLNKRVASRGNNKLVLILGSSLTRSAFDSSSIIENAVEKKTGISTTVVKIWRSATNLRTTVDAMPELQKVAPDILVVEANMFFYGSEADMFSQIPNLFYKSLNQPFPKSYTAEEKPELFKDTGAIKTRIGIVDTNDIKSFRRLALKMASQGTRVVLVNIPIVGSEEERKWKSEESALYRQNLEFLRNDVPFSYWDPNVRWSFSYYVNTGHMNQQGCEAFTKWFATKLAGEIQKI